MTDSQLVVLLVVALLLFSVVLYRAELALRARGYPRAAAGLAALRGLIVDAPAIATRIVAASRGRAPMPTLPEPTLPQPKDPPP